MNKTFWYATLIRAIRTICQTAVASIGTAMVVEEVNWLYVISASLLAGLLSVLTSIATGLPEVDTIQTIYNTDSLDEMVGEEDEEEDDTAEE